MGLFEDLKIICKYFLKKGKNEIIDYKNKVNTITDYMNKHTNIFNYPDVYTLELDKRYISKLLKYEELFALFAYNKNGLIYFTDNITVDPKYRVEPYISLSTKDGKDVFFHDRKDKEFIEYKKLYDDEDIYIGNNKNNKTEFIPSNSLIDVSYKIIENETSIKYNFGFPKEVSLKVGTTLRRHKTSGTAYRDYHTMKLDIITNLCRFRASNAKLCNSDDEYIKSYIFDNNLVPKLVFDVVNDVLIFCILDIEKNLMITAIVNSVFYYLGKNDNTESVELCLRNGKSIILYPKEKCYLHNKIF